MSENPIGPFLIGLAVGIMITITAVGIGEEFKAKPAASGWSYMPVEPGTTVTMMVGSGGAAGNPAPSGGTHCVAYDADCNIIDKPEACVAEPGSELALNLEKCTSWRVEVGEKP